MSTTWAWALTPAWHLTMFSEFGGPTWDAVRFVACCLLGAGATDLLFGDILAGERSGILSRLAIVRTTTNTPRAMAAGWAFWLIIISLPRLFVWALVCPLAACLVVRLARALWYNKPIQIPESTVSEYQLVDDVTRRSLSRTERNT